MTTENIEWLLPVDVESTSSEKKGLGNIFHDCHLLVGVGVDTSVVLSNLKFDRMTKNLNHGL